MVAYGLPVSRLRATSLAAAGVIVALVGSTVGSAQAVVPDTLFPDQGTTAYDVSHYGVDITYRPTTNYVIATVAITAIARRSLPTIRLDFDGPMVASVRVDGRHAGMRRSGHKLVITPASPVAAGDRFDVLVDYAGVPPEHTDPDGSTEGWVRTSDGAIALGEPVGAMTWLPSNNTPGDKATYTYRITVPSGYVAAANGVLTGRHDEHGLTTWRWNETDPMATYLAMIGIGQVHDPPLDLLEHQRSARARVDLRRSHRRDGCDRPGGPPEGAAFRGEAVRAVSLHRSRARPRQRPVSYALETQTRPFFPLVASTGTIVHEIAHQWFGDSVTLGDWHDIWLAEGFATYAEWLWDGAHGGDTPQQHFDDLYSTRRPPACGTPRRAPSPIPPTCSAARSTTGGR